MKKDFLNLKRSRWLLLSLFALLVGASPTWAYDILSEGFESNSLSTNDWTTVNPGTNASAIAKDQKNTGSYSYKFYYYSSSKGANSPRYLISKQLSIPANATNTKLSFYYRKNDYGSEKFAVGYSKTTNETSAFTWSSDVTDATTSWKEFSLSLDNDVKYIAIQYKSGDQYYLWVDDINITCDITGPALSVADGSLGIASGYAYNFGLATSGTSHTFTLSNPGTENITLNIAATNGFGVSPTNTTIAAGGEATLTVTMPETTGSSAITISSTTDGIDDFVINVSGTIRDPNKVYLDFSDGQIPDGWTSVAIGSWASGYGSPWAASTGYVSQSGSSANYEWAFTSPLLTFTEGETIFFETAKYGSSGYSTPSIKVEYSTDGSSWTTIGSAFTDDIYGTWTKRSVTIPTADAKYIRFSGWYIYMRNIYGGQLPDGANFAIDTDGTTQSLGVGAIGSVVEKKFTITNSGSAALPVSFTDATDFYVAKTLMFTKPNSWTGDELYFYAWDGSGSLTGSWPGIEVTEAAQNNLGEWVYTVRIPKGATGVKFSDNASHETSDISTEGFKDVIGYYLDNGTPTSWKNDDFSVPAKTLEGNGSADFYVRMLTTTAGAKSGNIELDFAALNATEFTIPMSGVVMPAGATVIDFNDNSLPDGWTNDASNKWSFGDQSAYCNATTSSPAELVSKKLDFSANNYFVLTAASNWNDDDCFIKVLGSSDNGSTWTAFSKTIKGRSVIPYGSYADVVIDEIPSTVNKLKFQGYYARIKQFSGLTYDANDPLLAVTSDAEGNTEIATGTACELGWVTSDATATYYIKNKGTGTLTIESITAPAGITATTAAGAMTVASGSTLALTVSMAVENNAGAHTGTIAITTDGGNFEIPVSGVVRNAEKLYLDFSAGGTEIPAGWTGWDITNGKVAVSGDMTTTTLKAAAGEQMAIEAISTGSYYSPASLSYSYSTDNGENWTAATSVVSQLNTDGYTIVALDAVDADNAAEVLVKFTGANVSIRRIYGYEAVAVAVMETTAADIAFGMQTAQSAEQSFTISNVGDAAMTGLSLTLGKTGDAAEYSIRMTDSEDAEFTGTTLAAGQTINVYVKQLFDLESLGSKSDVLTIAADGQTTKTINLTGTTRDPSVLYVDFDDPNSFPEGWQAGDNWSVYTYGADRYAYQSDSKTPSALVTTPLTVADSQTLSFKVARYTSGYGVTTSLKTRYSQDGGATWSEYEAQYGEGSSNAAGSGYTTIELSELPAGNLIFEFFGNNIKLDLIQGVKTATAPALALTEGNAAVANGDTKAFENLKAEGTATYTLKNIGNADMVSTVAVTGGATVALYGEGEGVTIADKTVTLAAGKSATITLTVPFESPYNDMSGAMTITTDGWIGNMTVNYTATLVDPTDFVVDFADNARPDGWYSESWTYNTGAARIYVGTLQPMITEKIEATSTKNVLSFDAKVASGSDEQTLNVYTSTDRKTWSVAQTFNLTAESQTFNLTALADGEYYVKFVAANATIDNITGVKKLTAPEHDLFEVSNTLTATAVPGAEYTATVTAVSLVADESDIVAELWVEKNSVGTKVASIDSQTLTANENKTFTLTGNMPNEEGKYEAWITVKKAGNAAFFNTDRIAFTLAHNPALTINSFTATTPAVQADDNNQYTATFNVKVTNTGSRDLTASEVSVSLIDNTTSPTDVHTATWTAANSQTVFLNPGEYANDGAVLALYSWGKEEAWTLFTETSIDGFYSAELNGNTGFNIVRLKKSTDDGYSSDNGGLNWSNKYNQSVDYTVADGNVFTFANWDGDKQSFEVSTMSTLAKGVSTTLQVTVSGTLTDGENKNLTFYAREDVKNTIKDDGITYVSQTAAITAAPVITLNEAVGTVVSTGENRKVELSRKFVQGWNTICLPFAVAVTDIHADAKALDFTAYNSSTNELTFSPVDALEANKPYVIYVPEDIAGPLYFSGKTVTTAADPETAINGVTFQGTYAPMAAGSLTDMWGLTATGKIAKASSSTTMSGFRAYFDGIPAGATARFVGFDDDVPTGISIVGTDAAAEGAYNLKGQKVEQLRKGGLYIINGKKQVVK